MCFHVISRDFVVVVFGISKESDALACRFLGMQSEQVTQAAQELDQEINLSFLDLTGNNEGPIHCFLAEQQEGLRNWKLVGGVQLDFLGYIFQCTSQSNSSSMGLLTNISVSKKYWMSRGSRNESLVEQFFRILIEQAFIQEVSHLKCTVDKSLRERHPMLEKLLQELGFSVMNDCPGGQGTVTYFRELRMAAKVANNLGPEGDEDDSKVGGFIC